MQLHISEYVLRSSVIELKGRVDLTTAPDIRMHLNDLFDAGLREFVTDFSGIQFGSQVFLSYDGLQLCVVASNGAAFMHVRLAADPSIPFVFQQQIGPHPNVVTLLGVCVEKGKFSHHISYK